MQVARRRWLQLGLVVLALAAAGALVTQSGFLARSDLRIEVDLSDRRLDVIQGGAVVESYSIAVGTERYPTPQGDYSVARIVWNPAWVPPASEWARDDVARTPGDPANPMQGVKIYFREPAYFIHGTNDPESIGTAASHGCIRMSVIEAEELARRLMEHGGAGRDKGWFERVARDRGNSYEVRLGHAIPMEIDS